MRLLCTRRSLTRFELRPYPMPSDIEESLLARLPVAIQEALRTDAHSPLQQWLNSACYDAYALLRYASTLRPKDAYAVVLAAAAATGVDAAHNQQPMDEDYAGPLWRSVTEGQVSPALVVDADDSSLPREIPANIQRRSLISIHTALGLTRTAAVNDQTRELLLQQAIDLPTAVNTALSWFYLDLDLKQAGKSSAFARKFLTQWARAHPNDPDLSISLLRKYLDSARRVGVAGALAPLEPFTERTLSPAEAAWTIAWDEAARAGSHDVCSELAIQRALSMPPSTEVYRRWLFIHGLHEERRGPRYITGDPVRQELLDLIYDGPEPSIPASLCGSIAARTNRLNVVLRELLPYLPGPTTPLLRTALDAVHRPECFSELQEQGSAGALLALRTFLAHPEAFDSSAITPRTPARTPILDDYESNDEFMQDIFASDDTLVTDERNAEGASPVSVTAPEGSQPPTSELRDSAAALDDLTPSAEASATQTASATPDDDRPTPPATPDEPHSAPEVEPSTLSGDPPAPSAEEAVPKRDENVSIGPFDHSIFATLPTEKLSDKALVAAQNDAQPTVSDVLLAAFLPTALRRRADELLSQRITTTQLQERSLVRAIEERIELLPHSSWVIAELLLQQDQTREAKSWMKRAVEHTPDPSVRAERYPRLAQYCAQHFHDLNQAIHYLEESLSAAPCEPETIALLDTIYTRVGRPNAIVALYERALHDDHADTLDASIRAKWRNRLEALERKG